MGDPTLEPTNTPTTSPAESDTKISANAEWSFRCFSPSLDLFGTAGCTVVSTLILLCGVMLFVQMLIIIYCCWYQPRKRRQMVQDGDQSERAAMALNNLEKHK